MARPMIIMVSDNKEHGEKLKGYGVSLGYSVQCFTTMEWGRGLSDGLFRQSLGADVQSLVVGVSPVEAGAKILPFPTGGMAATHNAMGSGADSKVRTINELESLAIEGAIHEYGGNLTEAAKALGIGRATLYRKVKQYNIDPSMARKRRAA